MTSRHAGQLEAVRAVRLRSTYKRVRGVMAEMEVMGDLHGCFPDLRQMHEALRRDVRQRRTIQPHVQAVPAAGGPDQSIRAGLGGTGCKYGRGCWLREVEPNCLE